jgi:hypothetical protein
MRIFILSRTWRRALLPAAIGAAALALGGCNGGGVTPASAAPAPTTGGTSSPYALYASNYVSYAAQTNGAFLHSVQDGDVIAGFGGNYNYGCYSSPQPDMDRTQLYTIQAQANSDGGPPSGSNCKVISDAPPTTAGDYFFLAIKAPGSNATPAATPPLVIAPDSSKLLIQMGNNVTPDATHGHANVFTVSLVSDIAGDGSTVTDKCVFDQTLTAVGGDRTESALGAINYVIPLTSFTCSPGSIDTLKSNGVTAVAITVTGDKNPDVVKGEFNTIAVGYIGFTK